MKIFNYLTDEDWQSDIAKNLAFAFALALPLAAFAALPLAAFAAFAFAAFAAFAFADPKIFLVIGAYLHYRKRMKILKEAEQKE